MNRTEKQRLLSLLDRMAGQTVLVLADLVADESVYAETSRVYGDVARLSREVAFGLILKRRSSEFRPGGGANAINNLVDLGARVLPVGLIGGDEAGRAIVTFLRRKGVDISGIRLASDFDTTIKTRILVGGVHTAPQHVLRIDRDSNRLPTTAERRWLGRAVAARLRRANAVLISDYGYGSAAPEVANPILRRVGRIPVALDSRHHLLDYRHATVATPSVPELEELFHQSIGTDVTLLGRLATRLARRLKLRALLVTRGRHGMALYENRKAPAQIPIFGSDQVVDVTGAGDTVVAVFVLARAAGATHLEAAHLANFAGGCVVMKRGTATVSREELRHAIESA